MKHYFPDPAKNLPKLIHVILLQIKISIVLKDRHVKVPWEGKIWFQATNGPEEMEQRKGWLQCW